MAGGGVACRTKAYCPKIDGDGGTAIAGWSSIPEAGTCVDFGMHREQALSQCRAHMAGARAQEKARLANAGCCFRADTQTNAANEDLMRLSMELLSFELRHTTTSYDAWSVAVAEALRLPLAKASGPTCDFLLHGRP